MRHNAEFQHFFDRKGGYLTPRLFVAAGVITWLAFNETVHIQILCVLLSLSLIWNPMIDIVVHLTLDVNAMLLRRRMRKSLHADGDARTAYRLFVEN